MKLTFGFSPCPNDTFMFDAMVHGKIDTEGLEFEVQIEDVETLNQNAFAKTHDITKLSFYAYAHLTDNYVLLDAGSALGNNCGPVLISKSQDIKSSIPNLKIAIPGKYTTANLLLSLAYPDATDKTEMLFSDIEKAVQNEEVDAGLLIHESRFTYEEKGLKKIIDLGEYWEDLTGKPIPLGGIAIKRSLPEEVKEKVNRAVRRSVEFAFENPDRSAGFVKTYAKETDEQVIRKHIALYVNKYSVDLGQDGRSAVQMLFEKAVEKELILPITEDLFIPQ